VARTPSRRPWWWLAELSGVLDESGIIDCPWCGGPAERVPWHPSSSVRTTADPGSNAAVGIAFARASCLFGHWFLTPTAADPAPEGAAEREHGRPADPRIPHVRPSSERGRR
jgi:hypothetical protein